jgi:hypothetical protein
MRRILSRLNGMLSSPQFTQLCEARLSSETMSRTTATTRNDFTDLMEGAVKAGIFESKSDVIRHVLRAYFNENQNARVAATVSLYEDVEITLGTVLASLISTDSRCGIYRVKRMWNYGSAPKTWMLREMTSKPPAILNGRSTDERDGSRHHRSTELRAGGSRRVAAGSASLRNRGCSSRRARTRG